MSCQEYFIKDKNNKKFCTCRLDENGFLILKTKNAMISLADLNIKAAGIHRLGKSRYKNH